MVTPPEKVEVMAGIVLEWLDDQRIYGFTISTGKRAALEKYLETGLSIINAWPENRPYLTLQDVSHPDTGFSPVLRQIAEKFLQVIAEKGLEGRIAGIISRGFAGHLIQLFVRAFGPKVPGVEIRMFFEREKAVHWLREKLD